MALKTKDYFKINGVSSDDFPNLLVNLPPIPPLAERRYDEFDAGGDENYVIPDDYFSGISYSIEFITVDVLEYDNSALYKLISEAKTLEISRLGGYYYKVKKAVLSPPTSTYDGQKVKYKLNFTLSPFKYFKENPEISVNSGDTITNKGTRYCLPLIKLTGTGTLSITVNGDVFTVTSDGGEIIVDCAKKITYYADTKKLLYNRTTGFYPIFASGDNSVAYTADSMKITLNERSY